MYSEKPKRVFVAQPKRDSNSKAHWRVIPIGNFNISEDKFLDKPYRAIGWNHEPWEIFYHAEEVEFLRKQIQDLEAKLCQQK